jgi:hypothetical protein
MIKYVFMACENIRSKLSANAKIIEERAEKFRKGEGVQGSFVMRNIFIGKT